MFQSYEHNILVVKRGNGWVSNKDDVLVLKQEHVLVAKKDNVVFVKKDNVSVLNNRTMPWF